MKQERLKIKKINSNAISNETIKSGAYALFDYLMAGGVFAYFYHFDREPWTKASTIEIIIMCMWLALGIHNTKETITGLKEDKSK